MSWDHKYRMLDEGEVIEAGDECLIDTHLGWRPANPLTLGKRAPSPLYTSHRWYRRKKVVASQ